ncbi:hypothetical protein FQA39_LY12300 [Lamprigera yunnana]|nr:hypothetical protein FQA39_LY12300 [Lamprigera yunnana]
MLKLLISISALVVIAKCTSSVPELINMRIAGGRAAMEHEFPYLVSLQYEDRHHCGGSIISVCCILTAAHCISSFSIDSLTVVAGINYLDEEGIRYTVQQVIPHEKYNDRTYFYDIGIVILTSKIEFSQFIGSIPLESKFIIPGSTVEFSGWGTNVIDGNAETILQTVSLKIISYDQCKLKHSSLSPIPEAQICTFTKVGQGICQGDSGGPLVFKGYQVGIASAGRPCAIGFPEIYTNVSFFYDWINLSTSKVIQDQLLSNKQ